MKSIENISWTMAIVLCLTIGLAPFTPPHIVGKIQMLISGDLHRLIDWFDLLLHGSPWILLIFKAILSIKR